MELRNRCERARICVDPCERCAGCASMRNEAVGEILRAMRDAGRRTDHIEAAVRSLPLFRLAALLAQWTEPSLVY